MGVRRCQRKDARFRVAFLSLTAAARFTPIVDPAELLLVLMLQDLERVDRIGEFWGYPESRAFAELLIDCEKDLTLRAVLVGMLREMERQRRGRA